ncbi:hypothetical protein NQ318_023566 [Aromia moschata]|uniref:PiggyBac transposable element-derived protein domain-containing protein n=1 Tax=Aromia moschata TaxID=1265417 RepID=A0AAV8YRI1_9CUCU|nr:hypothetical protein NQ318_023566 [Aromia moschata]
MIIIYFPKVRRVIKRFMMDFPEIRPQTFYGNKSKTIICDIPSESEDSELSDDDDQMEMIPHVDAETEFQDIDDLIDLDDVPLARLFDLPPNSIYFSKNEENITWRDSRTTRTVEENIFLGETNLPDSILELDSPYKLFKFFFSGEFLSKIVEQTCLYSVQQRPEKPIRIDSKDIENFLGILVWMANIRQHSTRRYWAPATRVPQIANVMHLNRFEEIKRFLHFSDDSKATKNTDKILPILNQI